MTLYSEEEYKEYIREQEEPDIEIVKHYKSLKDQMIELTALHKDLCLKKFGKPDIPKEELMKLKDEIIKKLEEQQAKFFGEYSDEEIFIKESEMEI
jgi:hypothetical protein